MYAQSMAIALVCGVTVSLVTVTSDAKKMCDQDGLITCTNNYMKDISTRLLEGIAYVCSGRESFKSTLNNCITKRSAGCGYGLRRAYSLQVKTVHDHLFHMIDSFFCSPTPPCNVTHLLRCYDAVLRRLSIKIPRELRKTGEFLDNLPFLLFKDEATYCSVTADRDFTKSASCLNNRYKKLFKTCVHDDIKSTNLTKKQSEYIFQGAIGQFTSSDYMDASRTGMCKKECTGFVKRYRNIKQCAKEYNEEIKHLFDTGMYVLEDNCHFLQNYSSCVHRNIGDCPALANQLRINKDLLSSMSKCGLAINSAVLVTGSTTLILFWLLQITIGRSLL